MEVLYSQGIIDEYKASFQLNVDINEPSYVDFGAPVTSRYTGKVFSVK